MSAIRLAPAEPRFDRPELDVLRFFAFLLVFLHHAAPFPTSTNPVLHALYLVSVGGAFGVDVFFVLSAYLITELLRREKQRSGSLDLKAFYMRRILRIWPLYYSFLFGVAFFTRHSPARLSMNALLAFSLLVGNWYCTRGFILGPAGPLWSVSIEEQFYLAWPLLLQVLRRGQIIVLSFGLILVAACVKVMLLSHTAQRAALWCNTFARMDTIAIGVLAAYLLEGRIPQLRRGMRIALFLCGVLCLYFAVARFDVFDALTVANGMTGYTLGLLAACAFFFSFLGVRNQGLARTAMKPLRFMGRISYGLYVFHVLAIELWAPPHFASLHTIQAFLTAVVFAVVSYYCLEKPFLKLKDKFTRVPSVPIVA